MRTTQPQTSLPPPGLTNESVAELRATHGRNSLVVKVKLSSSTMMKEVVPEPMFLLAACAVHIGLDRTEEAITLIVLC